MAKLNFYFSKRIFQTLFFLVILGVAIAWYTTREPTIGDDFTLRHREQTWNFFTHVKPVNLLVFSDAKKIRAEDFILNPANRAFRQLRPEEIKQVQLILVDVGAGETGAREVAEQAAQFFPEFVGLTGSESEIQRTLKLFGNSSEAKGSRLADSVAHPESLFFLDQKGHVIDTLQPPFSPEEILVKIKKRL